VEEFQPITCRLGRKLRSNLGPNAAKLGPKPDTTTQSKAKRTNQIDFRSRLCKQGVAGSIPATSTIYLHRYSFHAAPAMQDVENVFQNDFTAWAWTGRCKFSVEAGRAEFLACLSLCQGGPAAKECRKARVGRRRHCDALERIVDLGEERQRAIRAHIPPTRHPRTLSVKPCRNGFSVQENTKGEALLSVDPKQVLAVGRKSQIAICPDIAPSGMYLPSRKSPISYLPVGVGGMPK
jgi:hypothetical protein